MSKSNIEWTHYTFNTWWGCSKVSAGCKNCYAEALDKRFVGTTGPHWGDGAQRKMFDDAHWNKPLRWNRKAEREGVRYRVFCASMADVFEVHPVEEENRKLDAARHRLWKLIEATPHLDWLLLTKRPENHELVPLAWQTGSRRPPNVWLGVTAENQEQADIRIPILLEAKWPAVRFVSYEPALGPIDLEAFVCDRSGEPAAGFPYWPQKEDHGLDWIICGGESGPGRREMNLDWVRMMRAQCWWSEIPFFFKQKVEGGKKVSLPLLDGVRHAAFPRLNCDCTCVGTERCTCPCHQRNYQ